MLYGDEVMQIRRLGSGQDFIRKQQFCTATKQYKLVQVKRQWCDTAGKITAGLALHLPGTTDLSGLYKLKA